MDAEHVLVQRLNSIDLQLRSADDDLVLVQHVDSSPGGHAVRDQRVTADHGVVTDGEVSEHAGKRADLDAVAKAWMPLAQGLSAMPVAPITTP